MTPTVPNRVRQILWILLAIVAAPFGLVGFVLVRDSLANPIQGIRDVQGIVDFVRGSHSHAPPGGVHVCLEAYAGPFTGYPLHCQTDIGSAPIHSPAHVWCISIVRHGKDAVEVQVFYGKSGIVDQRVSGSGDVAWVEVKRTDIPSLPPAGTLPAGRYRCRFLVGGKVEHARAFTVT